MSEEDPKVVTIEMFASLNNNETYYFHFKNGEPVSFQTAINSRAYVDKIVIDETVPYYVDSAKDISYKLLNADGVELNINEKPTFEPVTSGSTAVAFINGTEITFWEAGKMQIKASFDTGEFDEKENKYVVVTQTATLTGAVKAAASVVSSKYSFNGTINDEVHTLRLGNDTQTLKVYYKYDDNSERSVVADVDADVYIQSTDETKVLIVNDRLIPVATGSSTIVLYSVGPDGSQGTSDDYVVGAYPIQILDKNVGKSATITLSKTTLNVNNSLEDATEAPFTDQVQIKYVVKDSDDKDYANYSVEVEQISGNEASTGYRLTAVKANEGYYTPSDFQTVGSHPANGFSVIRFTVTIKDNAVTGKVIGSNTFSLTLADIASNQADAWKIRASKTSLDTSLKNWKTTNPANEISTIEVYAVKISSYGEFACGTEKFYEISSVAQIPATLPSAGTYNFVFKTQPSSGNRNVEATTSAAAGVSFANVQTSKYTVKAFNGVSPDMGATRTADGTYSFGGYHVKYEVVGSASVATITSKPSLATANVLVTHSDVAPRFVVLNGKAAALADVIFASTSTTNGVTTVTTGADGTAKDLLADARILQITWDGLNSIDNYSRVYIKSLTFVRNDNTTNAIYVKSADIVIKPHVDSNGAPLAAEDVQTVTINTLFKDN